VRFEHSNQLTQYIWCSDTRKRRKKDTKAAGNGKSAAASKAIGRGKKAVGKLAAVLDMPMDIFVAVRIVSLCLA
jgi:hypothetical protein